MSLDIEHWPLVRLEADLKKLYFLNWNGTLKSEIRMNHSCISISCIYPDRRQLEIP